MILAHLADLHLGYRAYYRVAPGGVNARERDVGRAFGAAIDGLLELPSLDLVLVAGDIFHTVRPSNRAITEAFRGFVRLREARPESPVVVIAGNHDSPRAAETGSILGLLEEIPGVAVVDDRARPVSLEALDASVLCLPHRALADGEAVALEPDPAAGTNILMLHGTVAGGAAEEKLRYVSEYGGVKVETSRIRPEQWDYVALGHYHIATELAPNMWYAGGIERTSTNIWEEAGGDKGFLTYDTRARRATFHPLPTREVVDLPRFSARLRPSGKLMEPDEVDRRIRERVDAIPGGVADRVVRLVIHDLPRRLFRLLDHDRIREYKAEALHFHLDARRPQTRRPVGYAASYRRRTLEEEVEGFLEDHWELSSAQLDRERLLGLARRYLEETRPTDSGDALAETETEEE